MARYVKVKELVLLVTPESEKIFEQLLDEGRLSGFISDALVQKSVDNKIETGLAVINNEVAATVQGVVNTQMVDVLKNSMGAFQAEMLNSVKKYMEDLSRTQLPAPSGVEQTFVSPAQTVVEATYVDHPVEKVEIKESTKRKTGIFSKFKNMDR